jgi:hypothetical protein
LYNIGWSSGSEEKLAYQMETDPFIWSRVFTLTSNFPELTARVARAPLVFFEPLEERTIEIRRGGATPLRGGSVMTQDKNTKRRPWPPKKADLEALIEEAEWLEAYRHWARVV